MINKDGAFKITKDAQLIKIIEDEIMAAAQGRNFETQILNLTEEEQKILTDAGYKIEHKATKQGYVFTINWQ